MKHSYLKLLYSLSELQGADCGDIEEYPDSDSDLALNAAQGFATQLLQIDRLEPQYTDTPERVAAVSAVLSVAASVQSLDPEPQHRYQLLSRLIEKLVSIQPWILSINDVAKPAIPEQARPVEPTVHVKPNKPDLVEQLVRESIESMGSTDPRKIQKRLKQAGMSVSRSQITNTTIHTVTRKTRAPKGTRKYSFDDNRDS